MANTGRGPWIHDLVPDQRGKVNGMTCHGVEVRGKCRLRIRKALTRGFVGIIDLTVQCVGVACCHPAPIVVASVFYRSGKP